MSFELYRDQKGEYRFRLKAKNGEVIAVSEGYKTLSGAKNGIDSVRENSKEETVSICKSISFSELHFHSNETDPRIESEPSPPPMIFKSESGKIRK